MPIDTIVFFILILLAASIVMPPLADKLRLPASSVLVLAGFVISELLVSQGIDTGIRASNFQSLIVFVFLPILIFDSAFRIDSSLLKQNLGLMLVLAVIAMVLSALLTATGIYFGINHPTGFPWATALVTGALLVATDPVAVVAQLKALKAPHRLEILLEGESLFNDATAIVLFSLFLMLALATENTFDPVFALSEFAKLFLGGALTGAIAGVVGTLLLRITRPGNPSVMLTVLIAYGSFYCGEHLLHVSGIMSTLLAGLTVGHMDPRQPDTSEKARQSREQQRHTLGLLSELANNFVFLLMGVTITVAMFTERWLAMLIAIAATLAARVVSVYIGIWLGERLPGSTRVPGTYKPLIIWGGLRGVVTIALALSLPTSLEGWWTVQAIAFGVVIFSLWFQAPTNQFLVKRVLSDST